MRKAELNERIRELCEQRGWRFRPWEAPPWWVDDDTAPAGGTAWEQSVPKAQKLRKRLIAEMEGCG